MKRNKIALGLCFSAVTLLAASLCRAQVPKMELPDKNNPDYVYCQDYESGHDSSGNLPDFSITGRQGVREGAGYKSKYGFSNVILQNNGIPPYPEVRFPRQDGILFVQYMVKVPSNFYLGRSDHGYYLFDSKNRREGAAVMDHSVDQSLWLDPEWDPHTLQVLRGSSYGRIIRSFEGWEPLHRGEWHSYQLMIIPSQKDAKVGRMKVWIDGQLANFCKHDTIPAYDTFWISNYWHSWEYVPKDTVSNLFESYTAPPHPDFEIFLDDLIVSKSFIEFGPNKPQVERIRFSDLKADAFTVDFDTTVSAKTVTVEWGENPSGDGLNWRKNAKSDTINATAPGYFHAVPISALKPATRYSLIVSATDARGRHIESAPISLVTKNATYPDFEIGAGATADATGSAGPWKGEVFQNHDFSGSPAYVRAFNSLSFISWSGWDSDTQVDTSLPMAVRYTKKCFFKAGSYVFRFEADDGLRVTFDDEILFNKVQITAGIPLRTELRKIITEGEHTIVVEHTLCGAHDWQYRNNRSLAFKITPGQGNDKPQVFAQAIYNTRFFKPDEPAYCGRWSTEVKATIDYGETTAYGKTANASGRSPFIKMGKLTVGKTYHWRVTAVDDLGNKTVTPDASFICGDTIPPRKILCNLKRTSDTALELSFSAPGEDGRYGQAVSYDIRWSNKPLTTTTWDQATRLTKAPTPQTSGKEERIVLEGLPKGQPYYVAVQAIDLAGQAGNLSNIVSDPAGPQVMDCDGDGYGVGSLKGFDPDDYNPKVPAATQVPPSPSPTAH